MKSALTERAIGSYSCDDPVKASNSLDPQIYMILWCEY